MGKNTIPPPKRRDLPLEVYQVKDIRYRDAAGFQGQDDAAHVLLMDGETPLVSLESKGNIYLETTEHTIQMRSADLHQSVSSKVRQWLQNVERYISETEDVIIDGDQILSINQNQGVDIVRRQLVNIGSDQDITVGGKQDVEVESNQKVTVHGRRNVKVDKEIFETTLRSKQLTTTDNYIEYIGGIRKLEVTKTSKETVEGGRKDIIVKGDAPVFNITADPFSIAIHSDGRVELSGDTSVVIKNGNIDIEGGNVTITGKNAVQISGDDGVNVTGEIVKLN